MKPYKLKLQLSASLIVIGQLISCILADFGYKITATLLFVVTVISGCILIKRYAKLCYKELIEKEKKKGH